MKSTKENIKKPKLTKEQIERIKKIKAKKLSEKEIIKK